jgi:predicted HD phosphohydrolase
MSERREAGIPPSGERALSGPVRSTESGEVGVALESVDALFDALRASAAADDEGGLSILEHSLQCATRLAVSHPDDTELQVAGLVHDLGWLDPGDGWSLRPDAAHDADGRTLVEPLLGPRVGTLVGGHVAAKRFLLATDPSYRALLSARSLVTLDFQGGPFTPAGCAEFAARADRDDLVALRRADDAAKVRGATVAPLETWRVLLTDLALRRAVM